MSIARSWGILPEDGSLPKVVPFTCTQVSFKTRGTLDDAEQEPPMLEASQELTASSIWVAGLDSQAKIPMMRPMLVVKLLLCV